MEDVGLESISVLSSEAGQQLQEGVQITTFMSYTFCNILSRHDWFQR